MKEGISWMNERTNKWMNGKLYGWMDGWTCTNYQMSDQMNEWKKKSTKKMNEWTNERMNTLTLSNSTSNSKDAFGGTLPPPTPWIRKKT